MVESFAQRAKEGTLRPQGGSSADLSVARKQVFVQQLIAAYRYLGTQWADLDPLKRTERPHIPELEPAFYDLTEPDMDMAFNASARCPVSAEERRRPCARSLQGLRETYCGTIGGQVHVHQRHGPEDLDSAAPGTNALQADVPAETRRSAFSNA